MKKRFYCLVFLLLTACAAPKVQPYNVSVHSPTLSVDTTTFITADNTALPVRKWLPTIPLKAVIVALHGFDDYSNAFTLPSPEFTEQGVAIYAYDQRRPRRTPETGIWAGEDNLTRDAKDFVYSIKRKYPHVPLYVMGESMGGAVVIATFMQTDAPQVDGIILVAPAVWGGGAFNPIVRLPLWLLVHTWPEKKFTGENMHIRASDNIPMLRALAADPLFIKATRADALYGLVNLMDDAHAGIGNLHAPVLLLYGGHDQVIPSSAVKECARELKSHDKIIYYPEGYHMLLRDIERNEPIEDIVFWIKQTDKTLPATMDDDTKHWLQ